MTQHQNTIFEQFLAPIFRVLIDPAPLRQFRDSIDWQTASDRLRNPTVTYPTYYSSQNFHGIEGGYLNLDAAVSYDPITQYVLPPNETWVRQGLLDAIRVIPSRILDLGCGTGSTTMMLKQAFPKAQVIGLDLSPYMLVVAEHKAQTSGLIVEWIHGLAEQTSWADNTFDLITASLLFHETPPEVTRAIVQEGFRVLKPGGQFIVLDGNQQTLRQIDWLNRIFEEPYIQSYATESIDAWMGRAGFRAVQTSEHWWVHQITAGVKPLSNQSVDLSTAIEAQTWIDQPDIPALA
jgi:ubiquinone/menaquinone biosynthesis C-methylase UbiE